MGMKFKPKSETVTEFEAVDHARNEAAARLRIAQQKLAAAKAEVAAIQTRYDAATAALALGMAPAEPLAEIRRAMMAAEDALHGAGIAAKGAQDELHAADAVYQPLAQREQQRQKEARIEQAAAEYRAHLTAARKLLTEGQEHTRQMERAINSLAAEGLEGVRVQHALAREAAGLPVIAGEFSPGTIGGIKWGV